MRGECGMLVEDKRGRIREERECKRGKGGEGGLLLCSSGQMRKNAEGVSGKRERGV